MTRFTVDLSDSDSKFLKWLVTNGKIKNYSDVVRPAVSKYIAELKTLEGFNPDK